MPKFHGDFAELENAVTVIGLAGDWEKKPTDQCCLRAKTGEVLNWWPQTGTWTVQGANTSTFQQSLESALTGSQTITAKAPTVAKIFVVHGHDQDTRDQLELVLHRLGLHPFILQNADGGSKTIVEALEQSIYKDAAFGIVLLTPDYFGYSKIQGEAERKPRARQNVILEMGMVMAAPLAEPIWLSYRRERWSALLTPTEFCA